MSDTPATDSLVQRLAVDRVTAPGVLDHGALQRVPEKFSHAASKHVIPRLHRRVEPTAHNTESLPLVRIDRSVDPSAASSIDSLGGPGPSVATAGGDSSRARSVTASPFVNDLVARQTPGITRTSELVARRAAAAPGLIGGTQANSRLLERANQSGATPPGGLPPIVVSAVSPGLVQRVAMSDENIRATAVGEPSMNGASSTGVSATAAASSIGDAGVTSMVMRRPTPNAHALPRTGAGGETAAASPMPRVSVSNVSPTSVPLLSRKMDAPARLPGSGAGPISARAGQKSERTPGDALPVASPSPAVAAAPAQLLFRKPDAVAMPSQHSTSAPTMTQHAPAISSSPTGVIARMPAAPDAMHPGTASTHDLHLDWIAEQVGHRLARRLEVERERIGVRQWRQLS